MLYMWLIFIIGGLVSYFLNRNTYQHQIVKIYQILFNFGALYMLACYAFMQGHNYSFLLSYDSINAFIPNTLTHLQEDNFAAILKSVWLDYNIFSRYQPGFYTLSTLFGQFSNLFDANFYASQQIAILFLYPFIGIYIFKLLLVNNIAINTALRFSILISLFSILFFYSSQILRDVHVLLTYLAAIYITFKKYFSVTNFIQLLIIIFASITFRVETGLFLLLLIPLYFFVSLQNSKFKRYIVIITLIVMIGSIVLIYDNYIYIEYVFDNNKEYYIEGVSSGHGVIASLQKIPVAGDFASSLYNAIQPLPFWYKFTPTNLDRLGGEVYNIMTFPLAFASFFNLLVIVYIFYWLILVLFNKGNNLTTITKPLKYQLWIGLVFILLQSAVITQRRLMGYYCIYYIFFVVIHESISTKSRNKLYLITLMLFSILQVFAVIYLN